MSSADPPLTPPKFPNCSEFVFNYPQFLQRTGESIGKAPEGREIRIGIVGAGIAGLTTARELFRCGYRNLTVLEQSGRIGGRMWSKFPGKHTGVRTPFELGAMRFPLFDVDVPLGTTGHMPRSLVEHYVRAFDLRFKEFKNPGGVRTGVVFDNQSFVVGRGLRDPNAPQLLHETRKAWEDFEKRYIVHARNCYNTVDWRPFWDGVVRTYNHLNFRQLAALDPKIDSLKNREGNFGGLGLSDEQLNLLSTIGIGDGGWGAFYDIEALYIFRTILSGFSSPYAMICGNEFRPPKKLATGDLDREYPGTGAQSLPEYMFFGVLDEGGQSLFDHTDTVDLRLRTVVTRINKERRRDQKLVVSVVSLGEKQDLEFDVVVIATPVAAASAIDMGDLPSPLLQHGKVRTALANSHTIASGKLFFPLKEQFWGVGKDIPQVIVTDTRIRDVYGYAIDDDDPGVLLASYTWEEAASVLLAETFDEEAFAKSTLDLLDEVTFSQFGESISKYVYPDDYFLHFWQRESSYRGCAKLNRPNSWLDDRVLLSYNQESSARSGLYFAGEGFSVEGGWVEPALRQAINVVIHVLHNTGGKFNGGFRFEDYPKYDMGWHPEDPDKP